MVEILPDAPSVLLHSSEMSRGKKFNVGETVDVVYIGKDDLTGRPRISTKSLSAKTRDKTLNECLTSYP